MKIHRRQKYPFLIYMLGFFFGILYLNMASSKYIMDVGIWGEGFRKQYINYNLKIFDYIWYVAKIRLLPAGILATLSRTKFRKLVSYSFLGWLGIASGVILTSAVLSLGMKGVLLCIICMFPHFLCYVPAYGILLIYLFRYPDSFWGLTKMVCFLVFLAMGILMECMVNPVLLKMFMKTLG